jgi:5-methylthioadenosine/S-adenosylhomocysteine deaminase
MVEQGPGVLIRGGTVVTMDPERRIIRDGAVVVEGRIIAAVGSRADLDASHPTAARIDAPDSVILPGLVNTHTHLYQGLWKGLGDDRSLNRWLREVTAPMSAALTEDDVEAAALNGAVEAIRSGCTTLVDFMYVHPRPCLIDATIRGLERAHLRAIVARGFITTGKALGIPPSLIQAIDEIAADCERLTRHYGDADGLIHIGIAPCLIWMTDEDGLRATRQLADSLHLPITYHLAETDFEADFTARIYGRPEARVLADTGVAGPDLLAVHCTKLDSAGIEILRQYDVKVSHNPVSNMYLAAGVAPITAMQEAGLTVGLATDGPASNNNQNMVHVLKYAALLQKVAHEDPTALTADRVLAMATIDGARAIGLEDQIGSLEPGKRADIAVMGLDNAFIAPVHDPISALVYSAVGTEARTVLIDGRVVLRDGSLVDLDEDEILRQATRAARALRRRAGLGSA